MEKIKKFLWGGYTVLGHENDGFEESSKSAANTFNFVMGKMGKAFTKLLATQAVPTGSATGSSVYTSSPSYRYNLTHAAPAAEKVIEDNAVYVSPSSHVAAWFQGSWDPKIGAQHLASDPRLLALGIMGDVAAFKYAPKVVKATPKTVVNAVAKAGSKTAKKAIVAREINENVTDVTKNGRIEVTDNYFNSPNHWYRVSERPEKIGLEENGKNVTTADDPGIYGTINGWRESMLSRKGRIVPGSMENEGYFIFLPRKISLSKHGAPHGNTSQAAKGLIWGGTFAFSGKFPRGVIEGEAPRLVYRGMTSGGADSRSNFVMQNWEDVPLGARIGFHTGEMPMSNLGWFLRLPNGRYTYEPIIPEKRIYFDPNKKLRILGSLPRLVDSKTYPMYRGPRFSVNSVVSPNGTVNPRQAMRVQHTVSELFPRSYRMEDRLEDSRWHKDDPTTYDHTRNVALSAWRLPTPKGFTKQDQMIAALGHDFGKMISGDGHAQVGADLARQVFPDLTEAQYRAIAEHMGQSFSSPLGEITKAADITNGRSFDYLLRYAPDLYNKYFREKK